ncbi:MAG: head GIN domain-containing protein [Dehalococcoidia bacterium]|jgi:hypothetical protein
MKKRIVSLTVALTLVALTLWGVGGCIGADVTGSGNLTTETHDLIDFTRIEAHNGFEVEVTMSDTFSIEITADDNVHEYIVVKKSGDTLEIGLRGTRFYHSVTLEARVTIPALYKIELSGGSQAYITGFSSTHDFEVELSGGSRLSGDISAGDVEFELSGGSQVDLEGAGENLTIDASGDSRLDLEDFPIADASIDMSGGSQTTINISGTLNAALSGASRIEYVGEPTLGSLEISGESKVERKY